MTGIKRLKYNPVYSAIAYGRIKIPGRIRFDTAHVGEVIPVFGASPHEVFREIHILTKDKKPKQGGAVFEVVFHASKISVDTIIKGTNSTIPIFAGLPGFCGKKFMVNRENRTFSGVYEWDSVEHAQNYAKCFAARLMAWVSKPFPIRYAITYRKTGKVVVSDVIK